MTAQPQQHDLWPVPTDLLEQNLADRLRKSLTLSRIGVAEIAELLAVSRNTASNWLNGRFEPSLAALKEWALATGVPFGWLVTGELPANWTPPSWWYTPRDSNPEPAD